MNKAIQKKELSIINEIKELQEKLAALHQDKSVINKIVNKCVQDFKCLKKSVEKKRIYKEEGYTLKVGFAFNPWYVFLDEISIETDNPLLQFFVKEFPSLLSEYIDEDNLNNVLVFKAIKKELRELNNQCYNIMRRVGEIYDRFKIKVDLT